jgi:enoyl-CoA hydratase
VIVRGAGKSFCAGYDLTEAPKRTGRRGGATYRGGRSFDDDAWQMERSQRLRMALFDMHKPVIAQVHGHCLAGGTDVALLCDMIIAADDAVFGFPPARDLGALPNNLGLDNVGPQWAKRLTLTGDTVTGKEAAQIGLVLKSVPAKHLEAEVEGLADRMALIDPDLLSANKRIINLGLELMGARTLQRLAVENDARGHLAASARGFFAKVGEKGLKAVLAERDAKFGDGRARVNGPEIRDARGRLVDE